MSRQCMLVAAGRKTYAEGLNLQKWAWEQVSAGAWHGALVLLEHFPVVTLGRGTSADEGLLWPAEDYSLHGIELVRCNRGGKTTCHNPGQLVGYPVLNLAQWRQDSHWYLRSLEQVLINTGKWFGLSAGRKPGYTGVWIGDNKVAALGVSIRRWITSHGFALNIDNDLSLFSSVVPCGIKEFGVTSLAAEGIAGLTMAEVAAVVSREFQQVLDCSLVPMSPFGSKKTVRSAAVT